MGIPIPDLSNLPGPSRPGGGGTPTPPGPPALAQVDNVYSMEFDPVSTSYIEVDTVTINGSGSFSLWFNTSSGAAYQNILSSNGVSSMFRYITVKSGKLNQYVLGSGWVELSPVAVSDGNWHHLGFTYDSTTTGGPARGTFKAYVDGSLTKTLDMNGTTENWTTSPFSAIGIYSPSSPSVGRYFNGNIDEVGIFNTVLTDAEILSIYNATETGKTADLNDLTTPPVKWYRMGD